MSFYICVDIGGTNMTVGLFSVDLPSKNQSQDQSQKNVAFTLLECKTYESQKQHGILPPLLDAVEYFKQAYTLSNTPPINISACGPTDGEICQPTNLPQGIWCINKNEIQKKFDTPVFLINDFAGVSYGLMTIQGADDTKIRHIPNAPQSDFSHSTKTIKVALGAGTGLGCATIYNENHKTSLISSEGGWLNFTPDIRNHYELSYMYFLSSLSPDGTKKTDLKTPEYAWEDAISASRGIINIYDFFCNEAYSSDIISTQERDALLQIEATHKKKAYSTTSEPTCKDGGCWCKTNICFLGKFICTICTTSCIAYYPEWRSIYRRRSSWKKH